MVLSRLHRRQEHVGSNPVFPTKPEVLKGRCTRHVSVFKLTWQSLQRPRPGFRLYYAGIAQRLVHQLAMLGMAVRFCLPAQGNIQQDF